MPLTEPTSLENELATRIIGCAMIVHRHLGPGLIESVYETCFCHELKKAGLTGVRQAWQPIIYDGITFDDPFRIDILVNNAIIVENKVVETVLPLHRAQLPHLPETGEPAARTTGQLQYRATQGRHLARGERGGGL